MSDGKVSQLGDALNGANRRRQSPVPKVEDELDADDVGLPRYSSYS
mgnify:CR=1 FL=1